MTSKYIGDVAGEASQSLVRAKDAYNYGKSSSDLPAIFHKVAEALSVTQGSLDSIHRYHSKQDPKAEQEDYDRTKTALNGVRTCSQRLAKIFEDVVHARDGGKQAEYQKLIGGNKAVEVLMNDLLDATLIIAKPPATTEDQLQALNESLSDISKLQPAPTGNMGAGIHHHGSGTQAINQGDGNQNINAGEGNQFNGNFGALPADAFKTRQRIN